MSKKIKLIIGSTRQGRVGQVISENLSSRANAAGHSVEIVDLNDMKLPFYEGAVPPAMAPVEGDAVNKWREVVNGAEAVIFVTAEYNRSIPAPLKNAIDFLAPEWEGKPTMIVSYGMVDGGVSVTSHLSDVLGWLKTNNVEQKVNIKLSREFFDENFQLVKVDDAIDPQNDTFIEGLSALEQA